MTPIKSTYPQLSRPPLREAIIDLHLREELPITLVEGLRSLTVPDFSTGTEIKFGTFQFALGTPSHASVTRDEVQGIRFEALDGSKVLQYRRNGMTLSILKNYVSWEPFLSAARELWTRFLGISGPVTVTRLGVRYINAIEVPLGADFDDYLEAAPRIPSKLPQVLSSFFQRMVIPFRDISAYAIMTQALEPPTETGLPTVIDIDAVADCSIAGAGPEIWERVSILRDIKNLVFFASVTPKTLEAYE